MNSYIAIDLETTGLHPKRNRILEIGACRVRDGIIEESWQSLIDPEQRIEEQISGLTGISEAMVEGCPKIAEVIEEVIGFCHDLPILGHNINFDYRFLKQAAVNQKITWECAGIDTLKLCRAYMPAGESKTLANACRFYGIETGAGHRALADAKAAHFLYQRLLKEHGKEGHKGFGAEKLVYKVKREQPASKRQKERLQELIKYHKIETSVKIEGLSKSEASRLADQIISRFGRR